MKIEQLYTNCLAQGAYYLESNDESAIIDPLRDYEQYIELANKRNTKIKYIFITHLHADFVAGHIDLANKTGAQIILGPSSLNLGYEAIKSNDGDVFTLGNQSLKILHTPGHTVESISILQIDEFGKQQHLFSGDTLFIGDVGRPDLAQKIIADLTEDKLARMLYHSLRDKILPLDNDIIVYPAHGAGSACGKNLSNKTSDTLGNQKNTNYALNPNLTENEFVTEILDGLTAPPSYFPANVLINVKGYDKYENLMEKSLKSLSIEEFELITSDESVVIIDTRDAEIFSKGFIANSINIGIDGVFANWVGTIIRDVNTKIVFISEIGKEKEVISRLFRIGFDNCVGYLEDGINNWSNSGKTLNQIERINSEDYHNYINNSELALLDVRRKSEYDNQHIENTINLPLDYIFDNLSKMNKNDKYLINCQGGYRSMIFASYVMKLGYQNVIDVRGGFSKLKNNSNLKFSDFTIQNTML